MKRTVSFLVLFITIVSSLTASWNPHNLSYNHIKSVAAITEVFGDGQKVTAVLVEYDQDISNSKLSKSVFTVEGRTITNVYANNLAVKAAQGINGKYVIIELSPIDKEASIIGSKREIFYEKGS